MPCSSIKERTCKSNAHSCVYLVNNSQACQNHSLGLCSCGSRKTNINVKSISSLTPSLCIVSAPALSLPLLNTMFSSTQSLLVFSCIPLFSLLTFAAQVQFYDGSTKFGIALTSTFLDNATQVLMQITAPVSYGWAALGTGTMMADSTMFVIYPSANDKDVTMSIRTTTQHFAPKLVSASTIHARVRSSSIDNGIMTANIVWQENGRTLNNVVDPSNERQPFIWAVGPSISISSNGVDVSISEHSKYGVVFADMPQSQVPSSQISPPSIQGTSNMNLTTQPSYYRLMVLIHASLLAGAFVILLPVGVIAKNVNFRNIGFKMHWPIQCIAAICVIAGLATAVSMSIIGIRYRNFSEPHQIIGLFVCALVGFQVYLGWAHHVRYVIAKRRTFFSFAHIGLGRMVIYGGTTNAVLGFILSGQTYPAIATIAIGGIFLIISEFLSIRMYWRRRKETGFAARIKGYTAAGPYSKLEDVAVSEREVYGDDVQMRSHGGSEYINLPAHR